MLTGYTTGTEKMVGAKRTARFTSRMPNERPQIVIVMDYANGSSP